MSYLTRGKTKKYVKPAPPTPQKAPTPKKPSPKKPKIVVTVKKPTVVKGPPKVKPTVTRKVITQQPAGQAVQQQFKKAVTTAVKSIGVDFGVATVKTTVQETPTQIITVTDKKTKP